jgi:xylulose-5-phosphate/fructose-6-phosphate phosphoketolase
MHVRNKTSRYHIVMAIFENLIGTGRISDEAAKKIIIKYDNKIDENTEYIKKNGFDLPEIDAWEWKKDRSLVSDEAAKSSHDLSDC